MALTLPSSLHLVTTVSRRTRLRHCPSCHRQRRRWRRRSDRRRRRRRRTRRGHLHPLQAGLAGRRRRRSLRVQRWILSITLTSWMTQTRASSRTLTVAAAVAAAVTTTMAAAAAVAGQEAAIISRPLQATGRIPPVPPLLHQA